MKRVLLFFVTECLALAILAPVGMAQRFSANDRRAVVLEAFYALRKAHDGGCSATISGDCISNWNFINDSTYPGPQAYSVLKSAYGVNTGQGCPASNWALQTEYCYAIGDTTSPSFYSNLSSYGFSAAGGGHGNVGRAGECTLFANLLLYRSESDMRVFPLLYLMSENTDSNLQHTVEGDILQLYGDKTEGFTTNHIATVVQIYRSGGQITALDVIDSNYISDIPGVPYREVIARHAFCTGSGNCPFGGVQVIQGHYRIWKGTRYYNEPYNPNM